MDAAAITAVFGGVTAVLTAVGTLIVTLRNGRALGRVERTSAEAADATTHLRADVAEVHAAVGPGRDWRAGFGPPPKDHPPVSG